MTLTIYHNPKCSKSRETLKLLRDEGEEPVVVDYLKDPPSATRVKELAKMLGLKVKSLVRTKEDVFKTLKLDLDDDDAVAKAIAKHPVLLERPIVVKGKEAVIGRPPENVRELL